MKDGGWRRILRGTVTGEPGKGVFRQDGRRVFERGVLRRPARVSRTNPFPRVRPPFPAMEPPPSVCCFSPATWRRRPPSVAFRRPPWRRRPSSVAIRRPPWSRRPPSAAPHMPFRPPSYVRSTPFTAFSRHPMSATPTPAARFLIQRHQVSRQPILEHSNRKCLNDRYL